MSECLGLLMSDCTVRLNFHSSLFLNIRVDTAATKINQNIKVQFYHLNLNFEVKFIYDINSIQLAVVVFFFLNH